METTGLARIVLADGAFFVSAESAYDRELLFDYVTQYANQHGGVTLELPRQRWTVSLSHDSARHCMGCNRPLNGLVYTDKERALCAHCAGFGNAVGRRRNTVSREIRKPARGKEGKWWDNGTGRVVTMSRTAGARRNVGPQPGLGA